MYDYTLHNSKMFNLLILQLWHRYCYRMFKERSRILNLISTLYEILHFNIWTRYFVCKCNGYLRNATWNTVLIFESCVFHARYIFKSSGNEIVSLFWKRTLELHLGHCVCKRFGSPVCNLANKHITQQWSIATEQPVRWKWTYIYFLENENIEL